MLPSNSLESILSTLISIRSDVDLNQQTNEIEIGEYIVHSYEGTANWNVKKQYVGDGRFNVIASNSPNPEYVFVGHMDTVPVVNEQQPNAKKRLNKLYGCGAVDMKAGLAIMLALSQTSNLPSIGFVYTVAEEYDFAGIQKFVSTSTSWKPTYVINLEPTDLQLLTQCRGVAQIRVSIEGRSAHAANKSTGINAIEKSVSFCTEWERQLRTFDNPTLRSSLNLASLNGGVRQGERILSQANFVPNYADLVVEIRLASTTLTSKELYKLAQRVAASEGINLKEYVVDFWFDPLISSSMDRYDSFLKTMQESSTQAILKDPNTSGFFEVQMLQKMWNCPVIIFGPGPFSKSHQVDEYVDLEQLDKAYEVIWRWLQCYKSQRP